MRPPESLPARTYLLAFDRDRDKLAGQMRLGYAIRAAALADLWAHGYVVDEGGRAVVPAGRAAPRDPVLRDVWTEVADTPRRWRSLVSRTRRPTQNAVAEQLDATGYIRINRAATRWRRARIELRDPLVLTRLHEQVGALLRGPQPMQRVPRADAALVGLLSIAEARTAISKERSKEYADRIAAAVAAGGPAVDGLKHALKQARSSAA